MINKKITSILFIFVLMLTVVCSDTEEVSENKSGIYFNLNLISDDAIEEIVEIIKSYTDNETITETTEDKLTYKSYSENEIDLYNTIGPRLSNQERSILKKCKNINE